MDDYDEDLGENLWYLAFTHNHSKLFQQVTNERWMVCVPRSTSWKGGLEAPKSFNSSYFESHCIKFECESMNQKKDDANQETTSKQVNKYITYNGKVVIIEGSKIICGSGFVERATSFDSRSGLLDLPSGGINHCARILFEETYFNSNEQSYKVLCISRPLELPLVAMSYTDQSNEETAFSPTGDYKFSSKLQGYHLWSLASNAEKLKNQLDAKINAYIKNHGQGKSSNDASLISAEEGWESVEMSVMDNIQACVVSAQTLFNTSLQIVLKDPKIKKESETSSALERVKCGVERYVLHEIYGSVFRQISSFVALQEASFNKTARNLSNVHLRDLDVNEKYWLSLPKAKRQISKINKCCTPQDKLACLQQTVFCITARRENCVLGSDDLLPIFIYLVIKCNIPNWITNLVFLRHFQLMPKTSEHYDFYLTTLEAAIEHIKQGGLKDASNQVINIRHAVDDEAPVNQFFQDVSNGDLPAIKEILSRSAKECELRKQKMCHPLCACEKCSALKRRLRNKSSESSVTVQTRNDKGQTALHVAAGAGQHEVVDLLVEHGADLNAVDYHGSTPLHIAAQHGSQSVVFLLLHHGANANTVDNNTNTPLHLCCQRGHEACVKAFLYFDPTSSVVVVDAKNDEGDTPLHLASRWGYEGIVSALIECGASIKQLNRRRQSAVDVSHNARVLGTITIAANQVIRIVKTLKHLQPLEESSEKTTNPDERKTRHRTTTPKELENTLDNAYVSKQIEKLFRAVTDNDINMVKFLCGWQSKDEEKASENDESSTCHPLCQCTKCQPLSHEHVLHANSNNQERYSGLMIAAKHGYADLARLFLEHGASVNAKTKRHGYSPLHFASENGHLQAVEVILSQDSINPDIRDISGSTPLYMCAIYNYPECAIALLKRGASVNIRNRHGDTPLHAAVKWKNAEVVKILLNHGALIYYKNNDGLTPVDFAELLNGEGDVLIRSVLLSAANMEGNVSSTAITSISPHCAKTPADSDLAHHSSGGFVTGNPMSPSVADEEIADELYTKFKDPAPPTPPPNQHAGFKYDKLEEIHQRHLSQGEVKEDRLDLTSVETDDVSSDIFRDLLPKDSSTKEPSTLCDGLLAVSQVSFSRIGTGDVEVGKGSLFSTQGGNVIAMGADASSVADIDLGVGEREDKVESLQEEDSIRLPASEKYFEMG